MFYHRAVFWRGKIVHWVASSPQTHPDLGVKRYRKSCAKTADSAANPIIHPLLSNLAPTPASKRKM